MFVKHCTIEPIEMTGIYDLYIYKMSLGDIYIYIYIYVYIVFGLWP